MRGLRESLRMAGVLSGVVALALAVAALINPIDGTAAVTVWALSSALGLIVLVRHHRRLAALSDRLRRHGDDADAAGHPFQNLAESGDAIGDITRHLDQLLRQTRERSTVVESEFARHAAVLEVLGTPLILLDQRARIEWVNTAARRMFGNQILGLDLSAIIRHPDILTTAQAVLDGIKLRSVEITLMDGAGPARESRIEGSLIEAGDWSGCLLSIVDLSEVRNAERMRADFIANVSHELRTPLATLLGFVETLRGPARNDAEARERFLEIMDGQAKRMTRLVEDLLSLSRIEANEHSVPDEPVVLPAVLETVAASLQIEAERKDMTVRLEIAPDLPIVAGAADELSQVAQNLIENAIKYGRPGTPVEVSIRVTNDLPAAYLGESDEAVLLSVHDHGEGIPREHLPRLTERFYRVDTARSRELGGTGLGLAIVKHIVNRHRGALAIESEAGKGSTFKVYLRPANAADPGDVTLV